MLLLKLKIAAAVLFVVAGLGALALPALAQKPAEEKGDKEPARAPPRSRTPRKS
jgi:uncharacterized protein YjeT (DUF2065 family)